MDKETKITILNEMFNLKIEKEIIIYVLEENSNSFFIQIMI